MITNSERSSALCPTRWLLEYGLGLRKVSHSRPLAVGSFVHEGLDALYAGGNYLAAIGRVKKDELIKWQESMDSPENMADPGDKELIEEAAQDAVLILQAYHKHWRDTFRSFEVRLNEAVLEAPVRTPSGRKSPVTTYGGKVDKVVKFNGRTYIMEHKTSSRPLDQWVVMNSRSPQVRGYAWAVGEQYGIKVDGVIWDLIQSKPPRPASEIRVLKNGERLAKTAGVPWTTSEIFLEAVKALPEGHNTLDSVSWYQDTYTALLDRERAGFWLRREIEIFSPGEVERVAEEIYHSATKIRRWKALVSQDNVNIREASQTDPNKVPELVEKALHKHAARFPRESGVCWQYNRSCKFANICASLSRYDYQGFRIAQAEDGHEELTDNNNGEDEKND